MVSNLVAMMASTSLTMAISSDLEVLSAAHLTLHCSQTACLASLSSLAYKSSLTDCSKILSWISKAASVCLSLVSASDLAY